LKIATLYCTFESDFDDSIAQARTGTGKTLAFLLPIMQHIIKEDPQLARRQRKRVYPNDVRGIIISPTRELAEQIAVEAARVAKHTGIVVQLAVGGTQKGMMLRKTQNEGCHLLVGTPGRLKDILSDSRTGIQAPNLVTFVLDEADRLLDAGFLPEIEEIKRLVPDLSQENRQTMMLSATISHEVVDLVRNTLQAGFKFVQCVDPDEAPTHDRIPQKVVVTPGLENLFPALFELSQREIKAWKSGATDRPFKALVFFNSGVETILASRVFSYLRNQDRDFADTPIMQIHSKLTQSQRTAASEKFRHAKSGMLMSTDVTARGLDFPDVTHVIQIGFPGHGGRQSYIHRIGRTGRAGKEGEGWLILPKIEQRKGEQQLSDLPLQPDRTLATAQINMGQAGELPAEVGEIFKKVKDAHQVAGAEDLEATYRSYLGVFSSYPPQEVVDNMNALAKVGWGLPEPPAIGHGLAAKLGYSRCRGINIASSPNYGGNSGGSSGGFGGGRGGFGSDREGGRGGFGSRGGDRGDRGDRGSSFGGDRSGGYAGRSSGYGGQGRGQYGDSSSGGSRGGYGDRSGGDRSRGSGGGRSYGRGSEGGSFA
jgi:ATP-dependent RNA helicase MSS116